ncbi:hypothetical protein V7S43_012688 [Phytophthora oleae]|uniref:RxLR effector protein n=1 Tax=Phytophthora oleae TaxID=2107226 RepID=A0ABD3F7A6_9STRA
MSSLCLRALQQREQPSEGNPQLSDARNMRARIHGGGGHDGGHSVNKPGKEGVNRDVALWRGARSDRL